MTEEQKQEEIEKAWEQHYNVTAPIRPDRSGLRISLAERQNNRCCFCYTKFEETGDFRATIEHVIPKILGGKDEEVNMAASCFKCNNSRGDTLFWPLADSYEDEYYEVFKNPELRI